MTRKYEFCYYGLTGVTGHMVHSIRCKPQYVHVYVVVNFLLDLSIHCVVFITPVGTGIQSPSTDLSLGRSILKFPGLVINARYMYNGLMFTSQVLVASHTQFSSVALLCLLQLVVPGIPGIIDPCPAITVLCGCIGERVQ